MELKRKLALIYTCPKDLWGNVIPMNNHLSTLIGEYYLSDLNATRQALQLLPEHDDDFIKETLYSRILLMRLFITEDQLYTLITRYTTHVLKASNWIDTFNPKFIDTPLLALQSMWTCMLVNLAILTNNFNPATVIEMIATDILDTSITSGVLHASAIEMVRNNPKYNQLEISIATIVGSAKRLLADYHYQSCSDSITVH